MVLSATASKITVCDIGGGVGSARNPPIFMKAGDVAVCTIEGIGTLTNPVAASAR